MHRLLFASFAGIVISSLACGGSGDPQQSTSGTGGTGASSTATTGGGGPVTSSGPGSGGGAVTSSGSGGGGGAVTSSGSGGTGGGASSSGSGGAAPSPCYPCIQAECGAELAACNQDSDCATCLPLNSQQPGCNPAFNPKLAQLGACVSGQCPKCAGNTCNAVTNDGCIAGEGCGLVFTAGTFHCAAGTFILACDQSCVNTSDDCAVGLHCNALSQKCAALCCDDSDCDAGSSCHFDAFGWLLPTYVGVCATPLQCSGPMPVPSMGSCVSWQP